MAGSMTIRELLVRLGVVTDGQKVDAYDRKVERAKRTMQGLASMARWALTGITALGAGMVYQAGKTAEHADEIARSAKALQLTTDAYQELDFIFQRFGADGADIADALGTITDRAEDAMGGMESFIEDFALVGVTTDDLRNKRPEELFALMADRISTAKDENKALAAVVRIFGDDVGRKLMPALQLGSRGLDDMRKRAHELGVVMDVDAIATAQAYREQMIGLRETMRGLRNTLGLELIPGLSRVAERFQKWVDANRELIKQRIREWVGRIEVALGRLKDTALSVHAAIQLLGGWDAVFMGIAKGAGLAALTKGLHSVYVIGSAAFAGLAKLAVGLGVSMPVAAAAIGAVVATVAQVAVIFKFLSLQLEDIGSYFNEDGRKNLFGTLLDQLSAVSGPVGHVGRLLRTWAETLREAYQAMGELWRVGGVVVQLLGDAVMAVLAPAFDAVMEALRPIIDAVKEVFDDTVVAAFVAWVDLLTSGLTSVRDLLASIGDGLAGIQTQGDLVRLGGQGRDAVAGVAGGIADVARSGLSKVSNVVNAGVQQLTITVPPGSDPQAYAVALQDAVGRQMRLAGAAVGSGER